MRTVTVAALLLISGSATAQVPCEERVKDLEARVKQLEAQLPKAASGTPSDEGYQQTRWGMSKADVAKLHPEAASTSPAELLEKRLTIAEKEASLRFNFVNDKLAVVVVHFTEVYTNHNHHLDVYEEMKSLLAEKYGKPLSDETVWLQDLLKNEPKKHGSALSLGHLRKRTAWKLPKTKVELYAGGESLRTDMRITYSSRELEPLYEKAVRAEKVSDL